MKSIRDTVIPLSLALIIMVVSASPISSLQLIKPAMAAGTLTSVALLPTNNIVNTRTTYDIMFKTATTGTIKTIEMNFVGIAGSSFDISSATRYIERSGIGSGSLSIAGSILKYTVNSPVSVSSGTDIRLEIPRIVNPFLQGFYTVSITTKNTGGSIIDGPTSSPTFPIKAITSNDIVDSIITGNDISPTFIKTITLNDDDIGHAHGWNPDSTIASQVISGITDITENSQIVASTNQGSIVCSVTNSSPNGFGFKCNDNILNGAILRITIINVPPTVLASSAAVTMSSTNENNSSTISSQYESTREHDQIASEFP